jgi:hypothetical protein
MDSSSVPRYYTPSQPNQLKPKSSLGAENMAVPSNSLSNLWGAAPAAKAAGSNALSYLWKTAVPVNARILAGTMAGDTNPITEANFSPEELAALKNLHAYVKNKNAMFEKELTLKTPAEYAKKPETELVDSFGGTGINLSQSNSYTSRAVPYADYVNRIAARRASYNKTRGKTSVQYNDYPDGSAAPTFDGWLNSVWKSYTDPAYRMKTVLGSFNAYDTPQGTEIKDQYNFDKKEFYNTFYNADFNKDNALDLLKKAHGPVDFLDMLMIKKNLKPRNVDIKLK